MSASQSSLTRVLAVLVAFPVFVAAAQEKGKSKEVVVPRRQSQPPGPAVEADAAAKAFTVPEGFSVEVVAAEPELVNPVAMAIDERGRFWVTESFEYPRKEAGPGRDRIKILEDTTGDGRCDKVTIFAEGLNIPSGIAIGHGGVWVANAPDLLFMQDLDGDDVAHIKKVVVTGFGRDDTHELPNSLTWGPDGWLYGLNGVFNHSRIEHMGEVHEFTCTLFRVNPRPRPSGAAWPGMHDFELWAEGTSNPWGIAFNGEGDAFVSACVIDHLWHLTESGYYHRQGGPYPPHTWKLDSIVEHAHQMAAYCGIVWLDSDAYPEEFRRRLYMGNIHGGCINVDALEPRGSTYFATPREDFMTANDVWHMPVSQQVGPDGSLYVLDWYDRYHCYQDANADPEGVDRERGRLYRVRYKDTPRRPDFDLASESDAQLMARLGSGNVYFRNTAQRLLAERSDPQTISRLEGLVTSVDGDPGELVIRHALWTLIGCEGGLDEELKLWLLKSGNTFLCRWGVRACGDAGEPADAVGEALRDLVGNPDVRVRQELVIATAKLEALETVETISRILAEPGNDEHLAHIAWQNLVPEFEAEGTAAFIESLSAIDSFDGKPALLALTPRFADYLLAQKQPDVRSLVRLFGLLRKRGQDGLAARCLGALIDRVQSGQSDEQEIGFLQVSLKPELLPVLEKGSGTLRLDAALLAASWRHPSGMAVAVEYFKDAGLPAADRARALDAILAGGNVDLLEHVAGVLGDPEAPDALRKRVLAALGRSEAVEVAAAVIGTWEQLTPALRRDAIELLVQRTAWSTALLEAIDAEKISATEVNPMQARSMAVSGDVELRAAVEQRWGAVRTDRNPAREKIIAESRRLARSRKGDWKRGREVFLKTCAACHKMHGEGNLIGPDITTSGRGTLDQLLSNVFDPNLVIGESYQARAAVMTDGRVVLGLPVEDNEQRLVLRTATGQDETLPRDAIAESEVLKISLMPEGLELTMSEQERVDLLTYLSWDLHPENPEALQLAGFGPPEARKSTDAAEYGKLLSDFAPDLDLEVKTHDEFGVEIVEEYRGRSGVLRIHPITERVPAVLSASVRVPKGGPSKLRLGVSHEEKGDWRLIIKANGKRIHESWVRADTMPQGKQWREVSIDLGRFAGTEVKLEIFNQANDWAWEFGYFSGIWME